MNKKHAILITPEIHFVDEVHAYLWNDYEICQRLLNEHETVYRHMGRTGDMIVLDGFLNSAAAGMASRCEGFELFGELYYGNGLILPADETHSRPAVSLPEVNRWIRFFRIEPTPVRKAMLSEHAVMA